MKLKPQHFLILGFAALYLISPIDLLPDFVVVLGWLDDAMVAVGSLAMVIRSMQQLRPAPAELPTRQR